MKTKTEIIKETAEFYNTGNRGYNPTEMGCQYYTPEGNMCAVGRCLENAEEFPYSGSIRFVLVEITDNGKQLDDYLKPEYRGHGVYFWRDLQIFHDEENNWKDTGLTETGKVTLSILLSRYANI